MFFKQKLPGNKLKGRFKLENQGTCLSFIDDKGKEVKVSGTVVVEKV